MLENALEEDQILARFTSEQIAQYWESIKQSAASTLLPNEIVSDAGWNVLLTNLMSGMAQCWGIKVNNELVGLVITVFCNEPTLGTKNLTVSALVSYENIDNNLWGSSLNTLKVFARETGCRYVTAFSKIERIKRMAINLGSDSESWQFIRFNLEDS